MRPTLIVPILFVIAFSVVEPQQCDAQRTNQTQKTTPPKKDDPKSKSEKIEKIISDEPVFKPVWEVQKIEGVKEDGSFRGLHVIDDNTVWASGTGGTVVRTMDGGKKWKVIKVPGAEKLDFRDIHAMDEGTAVVISSGTPARIYRTTDGGQNWKIQFEHNSKRAFFNSLSFWDELNGIAMSDPIDGHVLLVRTRDGGQTWTVVNARNRPQTTAGEGGFAASGTNMLVRPNGRIMVALSSALRDEEFPKSRIVFSDDYSQTWESVDVPLIRTPSSGIFSIGFADEKHGVAVGGDYLKPNESKSNYAVTSDGGTTWSVPKKYTPPSGYRSCVVSFRKGREVLMVAVGPNGTDMSTDLGVKWRQISKAGFHAVQFSPSGKAGWATGNKGRIARWIK